MEHDLQQLSKPALIALLECEQKTTRTQAQRLKVAAQNERYYKEQITQLKRMLFGSKRERFEAAGQIALPFEAPAQQQRPQQIRHEETITYVRKKQSRSNHKGRLPLYRQRQRFLRENVPIAASTLDGWAGQAAERLQILYEHLAEDTKTQGYLQADETPIKVLDSNKKGACHQGYYWVYHNPIDRTVLFDYQPTRGAPGPKRILDDFTGYLQTDGYGVYQKIGARLEITHLACWAHARREFERALENDRARAEAALSWIQGLYAVERQARENKLSPAERKQLRLEKSLPIINQLGKWISREVKHLLPKSQIGKAMAYSITRWDALSCYLYDGLLEIDNNLVENAIRPVALGRKNYLFAGSHNGARRAAMIYSLLGTCKMHGVNPYQWLKHVLENILSTKYNYIRSLYPQNFTSNM